MRKVEEGRERGRKRKRKRGRERARERERERERRDSIEPLRNRSGRATFSLMRYIMERRSLFSGLEGFMLMVNSIQS